MDLPAAAHVPETSATRVLDDLFLADQTLHRRMATEAEIIVGIRHRQETIRFLQISKEMVESEDDLSNRRSDVGISADEHHLDLDIEKHVRKLDDWDLEALLSQYYGKKLPADIASSKQAKVAKWMELKDLDRAELNKRLPPPRPWDAIWDRTHEATLRQLILENRVLEASIAASDKRRKKASTSASIVEAAPGTLVEYAEALLLGRSEETREVVSRNLFDQDPDE
jgi:hypothetical protein